jgi:uncharacterized LabA/DUF88 family protein
MFRPSTAALQALAKKFPDRIVMLEGVLNDKTIVYIDFANVRGFCKRLGWQLDLKKLKALFDSFGVIEVRFYFGTFSKDLKSQRFMTFVHGAGYKVRTKQVKIMRCSIDVSSISEKSPDILANFIKEPLLRVLRVDAIEYLNKELKLLNRAGKTYVEQAKCNFDVEIASDMRLHHMLKRAEVFCLWSGDSDFADPVKELLNDRKKVSVFGTQRAIASELNELRPHGLEIVDVRKLRDFISR